MTHYDLVIIGSGSGNSLITPEWDRKSVAIVDGGVFGGTCLNVGCIPTKMFVYPAELAHAPVEAAPLGVDSTLRSVDWPGIRDRIFGRIDAISEGGRRYRAEELENVTLYQEQVRFTSPTTMRTASGRELTADQIVIAAGSRAVLPQIPGIDLPQVHTSDTVMRLPELPGRILIAGGGYIAAEFANIFASLGTEVIQINRSQALLRRQDQDVSERFTEQARKQWDVRLGYTLAAVEEIGGGRVRATMQPAGGAVIGAQALEYTAPADSVSDGAGIDGTVRSDPVRADPTRAAGDGLSVDVDIVLVATGRTPNTDRLGLDSAGVDIADDARLLVDDYQRVLSGGSPVEGLWALGDISSAYQLKHVANHEARVVTHNLTHPGELRRSDHRFVPAAVFTHPQIASVGVTEARARHQAADRGVDIVTVTQDYGSTAYGWAMEDQIGFVKLIAEKHSGLLLGAHVIGHQASLLIQPLIQAMSFGLDVRQMARGQYWIHPALTEVVENALLSLDVDPADAGTRGQG